MAETTFTYNGMTITIDGWNESFFVDGKRVHLTPTEFEFMHSLMEKPGYIVTYAAWPSTRKTLQVHVKNLRQKVEIDPTSPKRIVNVVKHGYKLGRSTNDQ